MNYTQVVCHFYPNKSFFFKENNYESFQWFEKEEPKPTNEHLCFLWDTIKVEFKLYEIRYERNQLLKECDFRVLSDYNNNKDAWIEYRQKLRDFPSVWIEGMDFPTPPS